MASSSSSLSSFKLIIISILPLSFTLFLLLFPPKPLSNTPSKTRLLLESSSPPPPPPDAPCSAVLHLPADRRCAAALAHCQGDSPGLLNYAAVHFCLLAGDSRLSLLLLLHFYFLISAARDHFSHVVTRLVAHLRLSPSMAAVTLLTLDSGSPDIFACITTVRGGHACTGLGAILSVGAFISAFIVGTVAVLAAPFPLNPGSFVRDVFFYLIAASALFYVYLSIEMTSSSVAMGGGGSTTAMVAVERRRRAGRARRRRERCFAAAMEAGKMAALLELASRLSGRDNDLENIYLDNMV